MTYLEILTDICSQVADPDLDTYKERAKDHFLRAISGKVNEWAKAEKWVEIEQSIPGFIKTKTDVDFSDAGDTEDLNSLKIFTILSYFLPPGTDKKVIITEKDPAELNRMSSIETLQPTDNDLFIYRIGNNLYGLVGSGTPVFTLGADTLIMEYVEDIDDSAWNDTTDLQAAASYQLSYTFMRECIDIAAKTLLDEVRL
ncbi:MAG: hypothetical protein GWP19_07170 [Planctomycetia bacterium]|nr:hypothetical protein [Planctomycetia bacterium]